MADEKEKPKASEEKVKEPKAPKVTTIHVKATVPANADGSGAVILFERHERHPNGEAFVSALDEGVEVWPTPRVTALIREGKLEEV